MNSSSNSKNLSENIINSFNTYILQIKLVKVSILLNIYNFEFRLIVAKENEILILLEFSTKLISLLVF